MFKNSAIIETNQAKTRASLISMEFLEINYYYYRVYFVTLYLKK